MPQAMTVGTAHHNETVPNTEARGALDASQEKFSMSPDQPADHAWQRHCLDHGHQVIAGEAAAVVWERGRMMDLGPNE
jgi:hypothetical protein